MGQGLQPQAAGLPLIQNGRSMQQMNNTANYQYAPPNNRTGNDDSLNLDDDDDMNQGPPSNDGGSRPRRAAPSASKRGQFLDIRGGVIPDHLAGTASQFQGRDGRNKIEKNMR